MPLSPFESSHGQKMRIFFECSDTATNHIKTGIQRVVRNVILHLESVSRELGVEAKPARLSLNQFYYFKWIPASDEFSFYARFLRKYKINFSPKIVNENLISKIHKFKTRVKRTFRFRKARKYTRSLYYKLFEKPLTPCPSDLMVLLDASWEIHFESAVKLWQAQGGKIAYVIYDILPITHPHFFSASLVHRYTRWFDFVCKNADLLLTISVTVRDQLRETLKQINRDTTMGPLRIEAFPLGAHLDMQQADGYIRPHLLRTLSVTSGPAPYLMVGTVEPRKNHLTVLKAFDELWKQGEQVRLFIVGKVGWECREIERTIREHPELHRRLFWFTDLSDTELHQCYKSARCVIFASWGEGFGLPIVEGLQFGCPVIASDLPVHREVAGNFAAYFNPTCSAELVSMIGQLEAEGTLPGLSPRDQFRATSWREGVTDLVNHCLKSFSQSTSSPL